MAALKSRLYIFLPASAVPDMAARGLATVENVQRIVKKTQQSFFADLLRRHMQSFLDAVALRDVDSARHSSGLQSPDESRKDMAGLSLRRVLVTSPTSCMGRAVVDALHAAAQYQVVALICAEGEREREQRRREAVAMNIEAPNIFVWDWTTCALVDCPTAPDVWAIVHPAVKYADMTDPGGRNSRLLDMLLGVWRRATGSFVLFSTCDVYGLPPPPLPIRPLPAHELRHWAAEDVSYPAVKHRCELAIAAVAKELGREHQISLLRLPRIAKDARTYVSGMLRMRLPWLEGTADDRDIRGDGFIAGSDAAAIAVRCIDSPSQGACHAVTEHFAYKADIFRGRDFASAMLYGQWPSTQTDFSCFHWQYDTSFVRDHLRYVPQHQLAKMVDDAVADVADEPQPMRVADGGGSSSLTRQRQIGGVAADERPFLRCEFEVRPIRAPTDPMSLGWIFQQMVALAIPDVVWRGWRVESASSGGPALMMIACLIGETDVFEDGCLADSVLEALHDCPVVESAQLISTAANCPDTFATCARLFSPDIDRRLHVLELPHLGTAAATALISRGFAVVDDVLPAEVVAAVASLAAASVGVHERGGSDGIAWRAPEPRDGRNDLATWVSGGSRPAMDTVFLEHVLPKIDGLAADARSLLRAGLRGSLEVQLACFRGSIAARQRRHTDGLACGDPTGTDRKLTFILYCNPRWEQAHAGTLRLTRADHDGGGTVTVEPIGGRLLCFLAGAMAHEVLPTCADRYAVTAWLT